MATDRRVAWGSVYLDHCPEPEQIAEDNGLRPWLGTFDPDGDSCEGCEIGGGLDCPGVWRWRDNDQLVTQEDRGPDA